MVAGPVAGVGVAAAPISVSMRSSGAAARVTQHAADGLFAALGRGAAGTADLAGSEAAVRQALAAQIGASGSAQANLERALWGDDETDWLNGSDQSSTTDGKRDVPQQLDLE